MVQWGHVVENTNMIVTGPLSTIERMARSSPAEPDFMCIVAPRLCFLVFTILYFMVNEMFVPDREHAKHSW